MPDVSLRERYSTVNLLFFFFVRIILLSLSLSIRRGKELYLFVALNVAVKNAVGQIVCGETTITFPSELW